ncbi:hypothetical protein ABT215_12940 [Streptomyces sp900105755]|uniref:hypothetical protein n=1 Tax=Streptomyces sp. 900105755 TaxID=3154389 RepID=UPI00332682B3
MNAIDERYKQALIEEHESYVRAKRTKDAEHVAEVLREQYGYDVGGHEKAETKTAEQAPQTAAEPRPPEATVPPKPEPAGAEAKPTVAKKTAAKRAPSKPVEDK